MTLILQKWNKQRQTKLICNSTAAHTARAPSAFLLRETTAVGHLETKPPDTPKHLKYEQEITSPRHAGSNVFELQQIFADHSSEYIQFDEPETLIKAIREVYDQTKRP